MLHAMQILRKWASLALLLAVHPARGQDMHFSLFDLATPILQEREGQTPEYIAGANYKFQWSRVPVNYRTVRLYYRTRFIGLANWADFQAGLRLDHDRAGDGNLTLDGIVFTAGIVRTLTPWLSLGLDLNLGHYQRRVQMERLSFGSQFTDLYHPDLPSGEVTTRPSLHFTDTGFRLTAQARHGALRSIVWTLGAAHLNRPETAFGSDAVHIPPRWEMILAGSYQLSGRTDLLGSVLWQRQLVYREWMLRSGVKYYLKPGINHILAVSFVAGWRIGDGFSPQFKLFVGPWTAAVGYDLNLSPFRIATRGFGGPEMAVRYTAPIVPPMPPKKVCPIF